MADQKDDTSAWTVVEEPKPSAPNQPTATYWQQHPNQAQLAKGTLNTIPGITGLIAATLATPEAPGVGTAAAGALGVAGGRNIRDVLAERLGLESPTTVLTKGSRMALDAAISMAAPIMLNRVRDVLTDPKGTLADVIEMMVHPQRTGDEVVSALRSSAIAPKPTPVVSDFDSPMAQVDRYAPNVSGEASGSFGPSASGVPTVPQATYIKTPNGYELRASPSGAEVPEGTTVHVMTRRGAGSIQTVPVARDVQADIRAAKLLIENGMSPSAAARQASGGNAKSFSQIMSYFMSSGGVK